MQSYARYFVGGESGLGSLKLQYWHFVDAKHTFPHSPALRTLGTTEITSPSYTTSLSAHGGIKPVLVLRTLGVFLMLVASANVKIMIAGTASLIFILFSI